MLEFFKTLDGQVKKLDALEAVLKEKSQTKTQWLNEKIDEELGK